VFKADARPIEEMGITAGKQHIETRIATLNRPVKPSLKYLGPGLPLKFSKGSTASMMRRPCASAGTDITAEKLRT